MAVSRIPAGPSSPRGDSGGQRNGLPRNSGSVIPGLDGLRGLAVILVLIYHFCMGWPYWETPLTIAVGHILRIGWVGVDIFFVLSGFLISGVLLRLRQTPHRWKTFLTGRALRIFPAYYLALFVSFAVLPAVHALCGSDMAGATYGWIRDWPWYVSYLSNFRLAATGGQTPLNLSVTWSLAVEQQFYLIWPIMLWYMPIRHLGKAVGFAFCLAQLAKMVLFYQEVNPVGYMMPCRIDQFALGTVLALWLHGGHVPAVCQALLSRSGVFAGVSAAFSVILLRPWIPAPPIVLTVLTGPLVALAVTGVMYLVIQNRLGFVGSLFESANMRRAGKYSYGMYLTHGLFIPWLGISGSETVAGPTGRQILGHLAAFGCFLFLTYTTAFLMYTHVEARFLALKHRASPGKGPESTRER